MQNSTSAVERQFESALASFVSNEEVAGMEASYTGRFLRNHLNHDQRATT